VSSNGCSISARSSKLLYKNIGPFKVLEPIVRSSAGTSNENPLTYRLQHVSTDKVDTYSVRHMFPFMRGTRHSEVGEALQEECGPRSSMTAIWAKCYGRWRRWNPRCCCG
jgi:hypothetical protein